MQPSFTFIDLFAGIGGMRLGFEQAGGRCLFSSEIDEKAAKTYQINHGEKPHGDITQIPADAIPKHDVLLAGFPCQPFSHAGHKLGIEDTRGTLFYDIARILQHHQPKAALLENVKGLISNESGETLRVILNTLYQVGYQCNIPLSIIENGSNKELQNCAKHMVLSSYDFGLPQNRQRIYIALWRKDLAINQFTYPKPYSLKPKVGDILEDNVDPKYTISDILWAGHQRRKVENKAKGKGFGYSMVNANSPHTSTLLARYYKDGSEILIEQPNQNPRKITPREAARLQGFPDSFKIDPSTIQAYKQFGNAVSVPVVRALAVEMVKQILDESPNLKSNLKSNQQPSSQLPMERKQLSLI